MATSRGRGSSSAAAQFPLQENVFALQTPPDQIRMYEAAIQELIMNALNEAQRVEVGGELVYKGVWEMGASSEGFNVYRQRDPGSNTRAQYRVLGNVSCDYRDVLDFHSAESSTQLYEWLQFLYHNTVDAQVLQTFQGATPQQPHQYFGVKWAVFQVSAFSNKSYQCFVEYMGVRKDHRGRDVGVRVTLPASVQAVDYAMEALSIKRFDTTMVQILRPIDIAKRPTTNMFVTVDNEFPYFVPATYTKTLAVMGQNLPLCIDSRRINYRGLALERAWVPNRLRQRCVVCTRSFGATRGRHHCRLCGDIMCRKCMLLRDSAEYADKKTFKTVQTKFCVLCISNLRETPSAQAAEPAQVEVFDPEASKIRNIEYAPAEFDETTRLSVFSETESEDYRSESDIGEGTSARSSLSTLSEPSSDKLSFASRLQEMAERMQDSVIDEGKVHRNIYDVADNLTMQSADVIATIDTKHMHRHHAAPYAAAGYGMSPPDPFTRNSNPRSLDQCLAEQEALLRQMVMASQGASQRQNSYVQQQYYDNVD